MPSLIGQSFLVKDILSLDSEQVSVLKYDLIAQKINLSRLGELIKSAESMSDAEIDFAFNQVLDMAARDPSLGESFFYGHTKDNMVIYTPHMFSIEASFGSGIDAASREEFVPDAKAAFFKDATTVDTTEKLLDIIQKEQAATEEVLQDVTEVVLRSSRAAKLEVEANKNKAPTSTTSSTAITKPPRPKMYRM